MAGSYRHITDKDNNFRGFDLIENGNDAGECIAELFAMIQHLSGGDKHKIFDAHTAYCKTRNPRYNPDEPGFGFNDYWCDEG